MSTIEKRLEKLESKLHYYQIAFIAIILLAGFFVLTAFNKRTVQDLVQAKEFQVVDDAGKVLISLRKDDLNGGMLVVKNKNTKSIVVLRSTEAGGRVTVASNDEYSKAVLAVTDISDGVLNVYNHSNYRICALGGDATSGGVLNVYNGGGEKMNGIWPKD